MKTFKEKLIFVSGSAFALVLILGIVGVLEAQSEWTPPTLPFPQAEVSPPLDTSGNPQEKLAKLILDGEGGVSLTVGLNGLITSKAGTATLKISDDLGLMRINGYGVVLPSFIDPQLPLNPSQEGALRYNVSEKNAQVFDGSSWKGIGSGDSVWVEEFNGIKYDEGDIVVISNESRSHTGLFRFVEEIKTGTLQSTPTGTRLTTCDKDESLKECGSTVSQGTHAEGSKGYDLFMHCDDYSDAWLIGSGAEAECAWDGREDPFDGRSETQYGEPSYGYRSYTYSTSPAGNSSQLKVGELIVENNKWDAPSGYDIEVGDTYDGGGGTKGIRGAASCPEGYYVIGIEAHDDDGGGFCAGCLTGFKLRCAKL